jgi:hypothetical protein
MLDHHQVEAFSERQKVQGGYLVLFMKAHRVSSKITRFSKFFFPLMMWLALGQWGILVIIHQK